MGTFLGCLIVRNIYIYIYIYIYILCMYVTLLCVVSMNLGIVVNFGNIPVRSSQVLLE